MRKLIHFGIPTDKKQNGEMYSPEMKLFLTDPSKSPNRIEYLRFESDSEMPGQLKEFPHIAYEVDSLEELHRELEGKEVVIAPATDENGATMAFVMEEGIPIEFMHYAK